jgi:hypothetical protein
MRLQWTAYCLPQSPRGHHHGSYDGRRPLEYLDDEPTGLAVAGYGPAG